MRRCASSLAVGIFAFSVLTSSPGVAAAAEVVLVHPPASDEFIEEIFHRLRGELRAHFFSTREEDSALAAPSLQDAQALLARTRADACAYIESRSETSVVHVWVAGGMAQPALFEAVALQRTADVPTILALRAVDLLTSALGGKTSASASAAGELAVKAAPGESPAQAELSRKHAVAAEIGMLSQWSAFSATWGPQITVRDDLSRWLRLGVHFAGPLVGAHRDNADASVDLIQGFALVEALAVILRTERFTLGFGPAIGGYYVHGKGTVSDGVGSIKPGQDDGWAFVASLVGEAEVEIFAHVSLVMTARALALLPQPHIEVGHDQPSLGRVLPVLALGIRFPF